MGLAMGFKVSCPACEAVLRPTKPLNPGQKVKCPKCGEGFTYQPAKATARPGSDTPAVARRDQQTSVLPTVDGIDRPPAKKAGANKAAAKPSPAKRAEVKTTELPAAGQGRGRGRQQRHL